MVRLTPFLLIAAIASTSLLTFTVTPGMARVILDERFNYYSVKGKTGREIFQSMIRNGPKIGSGLKNHALATTEYDYDIRNIAVEIRNGRCVATNLDLHVTVTYTYPRWRGHSAARSSTRRAWKIFKSAVVWHEKQHVKIAMEYAREYVEVLKNIRPRTSQNCEKSSFASRWRATRAALKHNRKQKQFDRRDLRRGGRGYEAQLQLIQAN